MRTTPTLFESTLPVDSGSTQFVRKAPQQLLKWIGNKQRFSEQISTIFPLQYNKYIEPFVGSGAVLGAMAPRRGIAGDALKPLIDMWILVQKDPEAVHGHYESTWHEFESDRNATYKRILDSYNAAPNPLDLVFISRSCYGGVVRFTKQGKMSTPIGAHRPIPPGSFRARVELWRERIVGTTFLHSSFEHTMDLAAAGDLVYCDPPYVDSQAILYGAQAFKLDRLWEKIDQCRSRGAKVALSIDGHKKSGSKVIDLNLPPGLFAREILVEGGSSMLRRFQKKDQIMIGEDVRDRLLLTW